MKFEGKILFYVKDTYNCVHIYKKKSKGPAEIEKYQEYIDRLKEELKDKLVKAFIVKHEEGSNTYIRCTDTWRTDLKETISPNHQKYINFLSENREDIRFVGPYKAMRRKGLHLCSRGHEWVIEPIKVKRGETCSHCKKKVRESNGAKFITNLLASQKIEFIKEVSMKTFGCDRDFRLDFVICQNNFPLFVIEFNGIQHYKYMRSEYFGGFKGSRERMKRDRIKREFCWSLGLPVIDIPYTETEEQISNTVLYFLKLYELI